MAESTQDAILKKGDSASGSQITHPTLFTPHFQTYEALKIGYRHLVSDRPWRPWNRWLHSIATQPLVVLGCNR